MSAYNTQKWTSKIAPADVRQIADRFDIPDTFRVYDFAGKGNIHINTFLIVTGTDDRKQEYLLQMLNTDVLPHPESVMHTWIACIRAQQEPVAGGIPGDTSAWEPVRLIPTVDGEKYLKIDLHGCSQFWRMMARIPKTRSYKNLGEIRSLKKRLEIAEEAGKGLAIFERLSSRIHPDEIHESFPGYRNTALYYAQLDSVLGNARTLEDASQFLPSDPFLKQATERHFLVHLHAEKHRQRMEQKQVRQLAALALEFRPYCLVLQNGLEEGRLTKTVVHGDTKLDNFLFEEYTGKVAALVDLDTVMVHTWLSDWGDMARSLINVHGEEQEDGSDVEIDMEVFKALARGFLGSSLPLPRNEVELMVDAARIMALELGVRFLTDYLRGDTYFKLQADAPEDWNKTRAAVQFAVFMKLGAIADKAKQYIKELQK